MAKRSSRRRACRFCGEVCENAGDRDHLSAFTHSHPSRCPWRQDRMPSMNGVHVGDLWRNRHTGRIFRILECRLGGAGTYTDHEPVYVVGYVWDPRDHQEQPMLELFPPERMRDIEDRTVDKTPPPLHVLEQLPVEDEGPYSWGHYDPMWGLVEHADPLTRPGEYPVPWREETTRWGYKQRSADPDWRCPGLRGWVPTVQPARRENPAYFHAWHVADGLHSSGRWEWWQYDPDHPERVIYEPSNEVYAGDAGSDQLSMRLLQMDP